MAALAATLLAAWSLAGTSRAQDFSQDKTREIGFTFNRTIYPINPGLKYSPRVATWVARESANVSSQDASFWSLEVDLRNFTDADKNNNLFDWPGKVSFAFNGTGVKAYVSILDKIPDSTVASPQYGGLPISSLTSAGESNARSQVSLQQVPGQDMWILQSDPAYAAQYEWNGVIDFPAQTRWRIENITYLYSIPLEE